MIPEQHPTVIIQHCSDYDSAKIESIIGDGLDTMGLRPRGRTLVKPNVVASGELFPNAYTRPEFTKGVINALRARADESVTELAVGERCGITVPTRFSYEQAGYLDLFKEMKLPYYCFEEEMQVEIPLTHKERLRDYVYTPECVAKADFFVNCPKFKAHPWTTVTFSMKNYIGIQDDRHRLIDHDHKLNAKVADLQHIIQPEFIAIDGIIAGEGRMLTPEPFDLKIVVMGNNQVAFDAVCCHIIGIDPRTVDHIRMAHEQGFGPIDLDQIQVLGDLPLEEARARGRTFKSGLIRVEPYFEGSSISAYAGPPPNSPEDAYCWGGCPGALEEAIEILRIFDEEVDEKLPRLHIVFGSYKGEIPAQPGEKVIFIGDCAEWSGTLHGQQIQVDSVYQERDTKDPHHATHEDIFKKMGKVTFQFMKDKKATHSRMTGCPVSVAEQVLALVQVSDAKNPYFDPHNAVPFNKNYFASKLASAKRALSKPYQRPGKCSRGSAAPRIENQQERTREESA